MTLINKHIQICSKELIKDHHPLYEEGEAHFYEKKMRREQLEKVQLGALMLNHNCTLLIL